jgi:crotonobetainyl-CoA:carnitine CoA-transferase CaiB-like acyl-CoA transferase
VLPLLEGVRIIEVGAVVLGPYAGQILADLGAEVIKVEPLEGDIARHAHPQGAGGGALFVNNNRNKKMLALDLKKPEGRAALARLVVGADVLFHNMRLDAADRLGLGYAQVVAINPRIIHCAATGFGRGGQYRDRPAFDDIIQAASGLAGLAALQNGTPQFAPTIVADKVAALHAVYGILSALFARERGQKGPFRVEVPMFESMVAFMMNEHLSGATFAKDGVPGYPRLLSPDRRPFRTADGWIAVLPYTEAQWRRFLAEAGRGEVCEAEWFQSPAQRQAHIGTLYAIVAESLEARGTDAWIKALEAIDVPCSRVATPLEILDDPHLKEIGFFDVPEGFPVERVIPQPVQFTGIPQTPDTSPHALGADSRAVLREVGYDEAEIDALIAAGVVSAS